MRFRVSAGVFALVPLVLTPTAITPADAAVLCNGKPVTINLETNPGKPATSGNDVIWGTSAGETIGGSGGDDTICGNGGNDTIFGHGGNDVILPGYGDDNVTGNGGVDTLSYIDAGGPVAVNLGVSGEQFTGAGADTLVDSFDNLTGSQFDDTLTDSNGNNIVKGDAGNDVLITLKGVDRLKGGLGIDELRFGGATQGITLDLAITTEQATGSGKKTVRGVSRVFGTSFADTISGSDGSEQLIGGLGDDVLAGRGSDDELSGQGGADTLKGGPGIDSCNGGPSDGAIDTATGCENPTNIP